MNVSIRLMFRLLGSGTWESISLSPEEYFERDEPAPMGMDALPRFNHAVEYLNVERSMVSHTKLMLCDAATQQTRTITEVFWNRGRNRFIERTDSGMPARGRVLVYEMLRSDSPETWDVVRLEGQDESLEVISHAIITANENASESMVSVYPRDERGFGPIDAGS